MYLSRDTVTDTTFISKETTVDLVIFAFLDFREFVISGLFVKARISELQF